MAQLLVDGSDVVVRLGALEVLGAFHRSVRAPLADVVTLEPSNTLWKQLRGMRLPGTGIPGVIALGTWRRKGAKDFLAVYRNTGVVVTLDGSDWSRLLVSCPDPRRTCEQINARR